MKKRILILFLSIFMIQTTTVFASSGKLKKESIRVVNGVTYGSHSSNGEVHCHIAKMNEDGSYSAVGDALDCDTLKSSTSNSQDSTWNVTLSSCVDGDTAKFNTPDGVKTTRFLAIDTPETKHPTIKEEPYGKEASEFTCSLLQNAKQITLEFDQGSDRFDKYDRLLAWVFVDDILVQKQLIQHGLAEVAYLYGDYKYTNELQVAWKQAKEDHVGMYGKQKENPLPFDLTYGIGGFSTFVLIVLYFLRKKR